MESSRSVQPISPLIAAPYCWSTEQPQEAVWPHKNPFVLFFLLLWSSFRLWSNVRQKLQKNNMKNFCIPFTQVLQIQHFSTFTIFSSGVWVYIFFRKQSKNILQAWCPFTLKTLGVYLLKARTLTTGRWSSRGNSRWHRAFPRPNRPWSGTVLWSFMTLTF